MNMNDNHTERMPGEMFLTNTDDKRYHEISYRTKRMGCVAYTKSGLSIKDMFPVFVQKDEYDEFMRRRVHFGDHR